MLVDEYENVQAEGQIDEKPQVRESQSLKLLIQMSGVRIPPGARKGGRERVRAKGWRAEELCTHHGHWLRVPRAILPFAFGGSLGVSLFLVIAGIFDALGTR
jgi:hypothetical protein